MKSVSRLDTTAKAIGETYSKGGSSFVEAVEYRLECGRQLEAVKSSMAHGEWLPWMEANKEVLGFGELTARRLMKAAANVKSTLHLDETSAAQLSRRMWGNKEILEDAKLIRAERHCQSVSGYLFHVSSVAPRSVWSRGRACGCRVPTL